VTLNKKAIKWINSYYLNDIFLSSLSSENEKKNQKLIKLKELFNFIFVKTLLTIRKALVVTAIILEKEHFKLFSEKIEFYVEINIENKISLKNF